jgi:hypothetical protein
MPDVIGFTGIGNIASAVIEASTAPGRRRRFCCLPQHGKSAALANGSQRHRRESNQAVLTAAAPCSCPCGRRRFPMCFALRFDPDTIVSLIPLPVHPGALEF